MSAPAAAPRHFSYSQLAGHQRCGAYYKFRWIDKIPAASGVHAIRGLAVHEGAAANFTQKIESRRDLPLKEVVELTAESVVGRFMGEVYLTHDERRVGIKLLQARTKDTAARMAEAFHLRAAPHVRPVLVEQTITVRPDPAVLPVDVTGRIDVLDDLHRLHDLKTKEKAPAAGDEDIDQQLTLGAMLVWRKTGRPPAEVGFDLIVQSKNHKDPPRHIWRPSTRALDDFQAMTATLAETVRAIDAGNFPPTNPGNPLCSEKWCPYWNSCPYVAGRRWRHKP